MFLPFWGAGVSLRSGRPTPGRLVEAQHKVSTARLLPPEHQARLEQIIEETEAVYQAGCDHLDDLLRTLFVIVLSTAARVGAGRARSRAPPITPPRKAPRSPRPFGACSSFTDSPSTPFPAAFLEFTAFTAAIEAGADDRSRRGPDPATAHLTDYSVSQAFADAAVSCSACRLRS